MRKQSKKGMSLLEVMVVFAIFASIGAVFIGFIGSSSKGLEFTGDYFNSVVLSQKISEDIMEEMALNPYGLKALGIDKSKSSSHEVVDGKSVFFSYISDQKPPYGKIQPNKDGGITNEMQPIYEDVKKFGFVFSSKRLATKGVTENRNLVTCDIKFNWKTKVGKGEFVNSCEYYSPVTAKKIDLATLVDIKAVDARIPAEVFNRPSESMSQIAANTGETVETVMALGRISLVTRDFAGSPFFVACQEKIRGLNGVLSVTPKIDYKKRHKVLKGIADAWYLMGKTSFQIVTCLQPSFDILLTPGKFSDATLKKLNPKQFQQNLFYYRLIYEYFAGSIEQSRYSYYKLLDQDIVRYKGDQFQLNVLLRLVDLYRIVAILPNRPSGMSEYKRFLKKIKSYSQYRIPSLDRMILQEENLLKSRTKWIQTFPNLEFINTVLYNKMPKILSFIKTKTEKVIIGQ